MANQGTFCGIGIPVNTWGKTTSGFADDVCWGAIAQVKKIFYPG